MRIPELKKIYTEEAIPSLMKSQGYGNVHQVPKIEKVVLNSSFGVELDKNGIEELRKDIASLAGQAPVVVNQNAGIFVKTQIAAVPSPRWGARSHYYSSYNGAFFNRCFRRAFPNVANDDVSDGGGLLVLTNATDHAYLFCSGIIRYFEPAK